MAVVAEMPLSELLPQAEPMILLSGYEEPAGEDSVVAFVDVMATSPFYEPGLGGVPACVALEYMAQTMALLVGLRDRRRGVRPRVGFVLGSRKLETKIPLYKEGMRYRITAKCTYEDESFGSFDCEIREVADGAVDENGDSTAERDAVVATATMTAFQPEGEMTPEKIGEFA